MKPTSPPKLPELDIVRAFCILAVIAVHATSSATVQLKASGFFFFYNYLNIFAKFGVPAFISTSAFVLFYNYASRPFTARTVLSFYQKRLLYILVPYAVFSVFYFAAGQLVAGVPLRPEMTLTLLKKLASGKAYTHLYYIVIIVQFYLLFPFLLAAVRRYPGLVSWGIPFGLAVQWAFILGNKYGFHVANRGSWCLTYFAYFMTGAVMGLQYPRIRNWLAGRADGSPAAALRKLAVRGLWAVWLASGTSHALLYYYNRLYGTTFPSLYYEGLYCVFSLCSLPVLLHAAGVLYRVRPDKPRKLLERLGSLSFGVYLIHPFFLLLYRNLSLDTGTAWVLHLWYAGGFAAALICSWLAVSLAARFLPAAWILFGRLPAGSRGTAVPAAQEKVRTS